MRSKFSFFKAGQGSFYGGRIWNHENAKTFTIVYDCGTSHFISGNSASLNNEITRFRNYSSFLFPTSNDIDLLFISHLDYDHVSGLKRLLTEFNVKRIVLPYIEKQQRQFFLVSISHGNSPDTEDLSIDDYISFIDSPHQFIQNNSEKTNIYFVKANDEEIEYQGYDNENQSEDIYPRGTILETNAINELGNTQNISVYKNDLQFFIQKKWEFTTHVKDVKNEAITDLHNCLKKKIGRGTQDELSLDDLKRIVTDNRKEAHKCYTKYIGEINSHGLVLLHGPIRFHHLCGKITSDCDMNQQKKYLPYFCDDHHSFRRNNSIMLGTLLFGDTSLRLDNNPVVFPQKFKDKLVNVHIVQVPHHGSSKNWDFNEFEQLNIGNSIRWNNKTITVCNFGYGNKYGHPSHEILNDLSSTIYLNSQFSRLNIKYDIIDWMP